MRSIVKGAMLAATAAALVSAMAIPASADPASVTSTDITAVGSDTSEYLGNAFASAYVPAAGNRPFASWNATNPTTGAVHDTITVKPGVSIVRPDGSSEGIGNPANAAAPDSLISNTAIDVARSSRGPKAGDTIGSNALLFHPFAEDTVRYALSNQAASNGVDGLTTTQLYYIYTCAAGYTDWHSFNASAPVGSTIQPLIPQAGSGTRAFFLSLLQAASPTPNTAVTPGPCVTTVQEHDPALIQSNANAIAPFSAARAVYPTNLSSQIKLNTGTVQAANQNFVGYRALYMVTRNTGGYTVASDLQPFVGDGLGLGNGGWLCSTAAQNIVTQQGFGSLLNGHTTSVCGTAEHI